MMPYMKQKKQDEIKLSFEENKIANSYSKLKDFYSINI